VLVSEGDAQSFSADGEVSFYQFRYVNHEVRAFYCASVVVSRINIDQESIKTVSLYYFFGYREFLLGCFRLGDFFFDFFTGVGVY
jgi:hypothetical protein